MRALLRCLASDETGQDLVEYALLAAFVGLAGAAALSAIEASLGEAYKSWDADTQKLSCMPEPGTGLCAPP